jgi:hypothetical protein
LQYFPYYKILGEAEIDTLHGVQERRVVIAFAKEEAALTTVLKERPMELRGAAKPTAQTSSTKRLESHGKARYIDVNTLWWYEGFFSTLKFDSTEHILAAVAGMEIDVDAMARGYHLTRLDVLGGWVYWVLYIKGYLQYVNTGTINRENIYYDYLTKYFGPRAQDPGLVETLADPLATAELVARRFQDFDFFRNSVVCEPNKANNVDPVTVVVPNSPPSPQDEMFVPEVGSNTPLWASSVDGYHRLFLAKLFGIEQLPCQISQEKRE